MKKSSGDYYGIVAESYDLWFPADERYEDYDFYRHMIAEVPGPALEIGCGTGRLLIPYLRDGLDVEGIDASSDMLDICRKKAREQGVSPVLHQQYMQELDLPRKYRTIYIPFSTFMILSERDEAMETLRRIYEHLEPEGQALIPLNFPRELYESRQRREWRLRRAGTRPTDGATVLIHEADVNDLIEQVTTGYYRYEVYKDNVLAETRFHTMALRWYGKHEFTMMLEMAGFRDVFAHGDYTDAEASGAHSVMVFRARK